MPYFKPSPAFFFFIILLSFLKSFSQLPYNLKDGRQNNYCTGCQQTIRGMPPEVLFGIQINTNGDVYFSMNNNQWFDKIFKSDAYGVSADIISEDRYACSNNNVQAGNFSLPMGTMISPAYRPALTRGKDAIAQGTVYVKIGKVPEALLNKKLEGNLVIVNGSFICYYTNFVNIDRNVWQLLPMGLYTDSLVLNTKINTGNQTDFFTYTKKIQLEIPFQKSSAQFNNVYLNRFYDSLEIKKYIVRKIEVRAYSSVEGPEKVNKDLMTRRADIIIQALKKYQPILPRINVITAENWLEFFKDIGNTKFKELLTLSKPEVKKRLTDQPVLNQVEPLLAGHRKAIITLYLETKSTSATTASTSLVTDFKKAVLTKNITGARIIQKELADRIMDNKLPKDYINRLEIPASKEFSSLLNDREVYKYFLKTTSEYEALDNFLALKQLDPTNGRINYNICALRFFMWQYGGDSVSKKVLFAEINALPVMGINATLVKRMLINYHILKCEENMRSYNYAGKDSSLEIIRTIYQGAVFNDEDIYSLAKYYAAYAHQDWAKEIVAPRIDKIDVSEDLVFYFINLLFYNTGNYNTEPFKKAILNAINLNNKRLCNFFLPNDKGGASMQLLEYKEIKSVYCDACAEKK